MLLNELFQKPYPYKWTHQDETMLEAVFVLDDKSTIEVNFEQDIGFDEKERSETWMIEFHRQDTGGENATHFKTAGLTGEGDAYRIFSTVAVIMQDFVRKHKPKALWFTAAEPSRRMLYKRMMPRLAKSLGMETAPGTTPNEFWLVQPGFKAGHEHGGYALAGYTR